MSKLCPRISMSLDGFVAGPHQGPEEPLGVGGLRLHEWVFPLAAWRAAQGEAGGDDSESSRLIERTNARMGATVMGRNMFGGHPGPWSGTQPWNGWWGPNPPFHHGVFVLRHHPREPLRMEGGTTFTFVTEGIERALELARRAASGRDVMLGGGAQAARQYLAAGLVGEMELSVVPVLLGAGERLFDGLADLGGLVLGRTLAAPNVTHLLFARK